MSQRLTDGHPTIVVFSGNPALKLWETSVTPPGIDGRGPNNTTTMRNSAWTTQQPKKLKTLTGFTFTAQYDPAVFDQLLAQVNVNQLMYVQFSDGDKINFWGWLNSFMPNEAVEGQPPTATVSVEPSNQDNSGNEVAPYRTT